jgi:hypothetical protein
VPAGKYVATERQPSLCRRRSAPAMFI